MIYDLGSSAYAQIVVGGRALSPGLAEQDSAAYAAHDWQAFGLRGTWGAKPKYVSCVRLSEVMKDI